MFLKVHPEKGLTFSGRLLFLTGGSGCPEGNGAMKKFLGMLQVVCLYYRAFFRRLRLNKQWGSCSGLQFSAHPLKPALLFTSSQARPHRLTPVYQKALFPLRTVKNRAVFNKKYRAAQGLLKNTKGRLMQQTEAAAGLKIRGRRQGFRRFCLAGACCLQKNPAMPLFLSRPCAMCAKHKPVCTFIFNAAAILF